MNLNRWSEPRRDIIRGVLLVMLAAWVIVFTRAGVKAWRDLPALLHPQTPTPTASTPTAPPPA